MKWRATIAWLHLLEPLARDWGRLRGGLTPWRSALPMDPRRPTTPWWRRAQPFRRTVSWSYAGDQRLDRYPILTRLTEVCSDRGCAVEWNASFESWDLRLRRGALNEASVRVVVEHHGGPRRRARFAAVIRPNRVMSLAIVICLGIAGVLSALQLFPPSIASMGLGSVLWFASIREADRLEGGVRAVADGVCQQQMGGELASETTQASGGGDA